MTSTKRKVVAIAADDAGKVSGNSVVGAIVVGVLICFGANTQARVHQAKTLVAIQ